MLEFLQQNYLTIIIIAVLVLMVALIIRSIVKDKKAGKNTCGANCAHCANAGYCHKTTLSIDGMACGMCEAHICDTIRKDFDVKKVKASHTKKMAEIVSKEPLDEQKLRSAIGATGYTVTDVRSEEYVKKGLFK